MFSCSVWIFVGSCVSHIIFFKFQYMQAVGRYALEMLVRLSDSYILPFNVLQYGEDVIKSQVDFETNYGDLLTANGINLGGCLQTNFSISICLSRNLC